MELTVVSDVTELTNPKNEVISGLLVIRNTLIL